ncbi:hypothetical protein CDD83_7914 [Cordyceps sp. RAO-2017]|nr:hypothetical protein CDD83_7914 [Cordyceps sp. RAO-2017]
MTTTHAVSTTVVAGITTVFGSDGLATVAGLDGKSSVYDQSSGKATKIIDHGKVFTRGSDGKMTPIPISLSSAADSVESSPGIASITAVQQPGFPGTTTTEPPRSNPSQQTSASSTAVSTAAVVGIAIACALAGLLIGFLAACIFLRRKRRKTAPPKTSDVRLEPKTATSSVTDIQLDQFLLEATPDKEITMEMQSRGDLIRQHVESHYQTGSVPADASRLSQSLVDLGFSDGPSPFDAHEVAALCLDPGTRQNSLQHVLLRVIFASLDFHSRSGLSMLPMSVALFLNEVPLAESEMSGGSRVTSLAFCQWRRLSTFLLHPDRGQRTPLPADKVTLASQAQALAAALNTVLDVFTNGDSVSKTEQTRHLEAVIMECAKLGYVLLSHPSDWKFITEDLDRRDGRGGMVVEAGLMKLSDREGVPYPSPRRVVAPVVHRASILRELL